MKDKASALLFALLAAVFYAVNTPLSKLLLTQFSSTMLAGFLYLGAGVGVGVLYLFRFRTEAPDTRLKRADLPYTVGMIVLDVFAPIFLMLGLKFGSASNAALLGNFEIVATTLIALLVFRETVTARLWCAIGLITASSVLLSFEGSGSFRFSYGSLFVLLATACWGLENNCTRRISERSTYQIVVLKGFGSGGGALLLSLALGQRLPALRWIGAAMLLGFVAYGLSIFLYIRAQRTLGAAKTSAYYAAAPFVGAALSFALLGEALTAFYAAALVLMLAGTAFVVWDTFVRHHVHTHTHTVTHPGPGGTLHTHTITHTHGHDHYAGDFHSHHHSRAELERELRPQHPHAAEETR